MIKRVIYATDQMRESANQWQWPDRDGGRLQHPLHEWRIVSTTCSSG